jgi:hypothetical protein
VARAALAAGGWTPEGQPPELASTIWVNAVQPALRDTAPVFQTVKPLVAPAPGKVLAKARFPRVVERIAP